MTSQCCVFNHLRLSTYLFRISFNLSPVFMRIHILPTVCQPIIHNTKQSVSYALADLIGLPFYHCTKFAKL